MDVPSSTHPLQPVALLVLCYNSCNESSLSFYVPFKNISTTKIQLYNYFFTMIAKSIVEVSAIVAKSLSWLGHKPNYYCGVT